MLLVPGLDDGGEVPKMPRLGACMEAARNRILEANERSESLLLLSSIESLLVLLLSRSDVLTVVDLLKESLLLLVLPIWDGRLLMSSNTSPVVVVVALVFVRVGVVTTAFLEDLSDLRWPWDLWDLFPCPLRIDPYIHTYIHGYRWLWTHTYIY